MLGACSWPNLGARLKKEDLSCMIHVWTREIPGTQ
jgi:hypothetical protein